MLPPRVLAHDHARAARARAPHQPVVGVDDAGVGAIAGPIFAAAVFLPADSRLEAAADSKTLGLAARRAAFESLCAAPGVVWAIAAVPAREVDLAGGHASTAAAMELAVARLEAAKPGRGVGGKTFKRRRRPDGKASAAGCSTGTESASGRG